MNLLNSMPSPQKILIISSNSPIEESLILFLKPHYEIKITHSCPDSFALLEISLILLDANVAKKECYKIFDENFSTTIPIIIFSSYIDSDLEEYVFNLGAADFISAPIKSNVLLARIHNQLLLAKAKKLESSSIHYEAIFNTPSFAVITVDKNGVIKEFNHGAQILFGYSPEEILNKKINTLMPKSFSDEHDDYMKQYFLTKNKKVIGMVREALGLRKNGEIFEIELRVDQFNQNNELLFVGYILDISQKKALEKQNYIFQSIVKNSSEAIIGMTPKGIVTSWNSGAERISGYTDKEMIGKNVLALFFENGLEIIQDMFLGKAVYNLETTLQKKNGLIIDLSMTLSPIIDSQGDIIGISNIFHDMSNRKKYIKDLQESEYLFRTVIDTSSTSYILYDNNTGFIDYVNPAFSKKFGDDLPTMNDWWNKAFLDPEYREKIATEWMIRVDKSSRDPNISFEPMEVYVIDKNGESKWILMEATPLKDNVTETQLVTIYDISEIKKFNKALKESELRWKFALEGSGDGLWDWDLVNNTVLFSKRWKEMLGFSDSEISTAFFEWSNRIHIEDIEQVRQRMQKTLMNETDSYTNEYRMRTKNGSYLWIQDRGVVVSHDSSGKALRMIGTHTDIHERKTIENRNEQLLRIVEESVDFISMNDLDGNVRYCNYAAKKMIGLSNDRVITNMNISNFHPEWVLKQTQEISIPYALTHGFWQGDSALLHADGYEIPVSQILMVHRDGNGDALTLSNIMHDVTEQKKLEMLTFQAQKNAEQLAKSKSEFLANMSHEIRTPINAVLGLAFVLSKKNLPTDEKMLVNKILKSGELLLGIINDVLDISKIESDKLELEDSEFDLNIILDNLATIMTFSASNKEVNLIIQPPSNLASVMLTGDSLRLQQVLVNLTSNAIKFTEKGYVCVAIECMEKTEKHILLKFSVQDTGIGISPAAQESVFSSFAQADASITRTYGGTGLGLAISRKLVALMGGEISLESEVEKGSTFAFTLDFEYQKIISETETETETNENVTTILIINDNKIEQDALCTIVDSLGWHWELATNYDEAKVATVNLPDVILIDWAVLNRDKNAFDELLTLNKNSIIRVQMTEFAKKNIDSSFDFIILNKPITALSIREILVKRNSYIDAPPLDTSARLLGFRLLIVDDNDINLEVAKRIFSGEGAVVITAQNGLEALEWLKENETGVDIILMDIQMPVMNGCEATCEIRKIPALVNIPIVALSAGVLKAQMDQVQHAGIQGFIMKPFNVDVAVNLIRKILGSHFIECTTVANNKLPLEFEGVDVDAALENWKEMQVYQTYLLQFLNDFEPDVEKIETLDFDDMADFAHKIKGASRALGLFDVGDTAEDLEEIADENKNTDEAIATLKKAVAIAKNSIHLIIQHKIS